MISDAQKPGVWDSSQEFVRKVVTLADESKLYVIYEVNDAVKRSHPFAVSGVHLLKDGKQLGKKITSFSDSLKIERISVAGSRNLGLSVGNTQSRCDWGLGCQSRHE